MIFCRDFLRMFGYYMLLQNVGIKVYIEAIASIPGRSVLINAGYEVKKKVN
jgi:hypothetical protein